MEGENQNPKSKRLTIEAYSKSISAKKKQSHLFKVPISSSRRTKDSRQSVKSRAAFCQPLLGSHHVGVPMREKQNKAEQLGHGFFGVGMAVRNL